MYIINNTFSYLLKEKLFFTTAVIPVSLHNIAIAINMIQLNILSHLYNNLRA